MAKKNPITVLSAGEDIEDTIRGIVPDKIDGHVAIENDGIGDYEFAGQQCHDAGNTFATLNEFDVVLDVTALNLSEDDLDNLPSVDGNEDVERGEKSFVVNWTASASWKRDGDKVLVTYTVEQER